MPDPTISELAPHDAEELLPWYATGQLEGDELARVEKHLSSCAHCRRQLAFELRMADEFARLTPEIDSGWERLKQRIAAPQRSRRQRWTQTVWHTVSRPRVALAAAAQLVFLIIAASILLSLSRPSYRTLGSAPAPASANVIAMFRGDTTEAQLRALLKANGASLVGGPTPADAYLLSVPAVSRDAALSRLHADRHVLMAQPIDGSGS
jgi:anti-sigma-K factor RskA